MLSVEYRLLNVEYCKVEYRKVKICMSIIMKISDTTYISHVVFYTNIFKYSIGVVFFLYKYF